MLIVLYILLIIYAGLIIGHRFKPMPPGTDYESPAYIVDGDDVQFIYDLRFENRDQKLVFEERIYPAIFKAMHESERSIVADMFLYNEDHGEDKNDPEHRPITSGFTDMLCLKGDQGLEVLLITDEINAFYGSYESPIFKRLEAHKVKTVFTDLDRLRDANPVYSGWYRIFLTWIPSETGKKISHPFGHPHRRITLAALFRSLNFKANHRKVVVTDSSQAIVTSANPHDPSSLHCNIAFKVKGEIAREVEYAERAVAAFSGLEAMSPDRFRPGLPATDMDEPMPGDISKYLVRVLTEKKIKEHLLREIRGSQDGEQIMLASLYLTDREVISAIRAAALQGAMIRIILDSSEHAFGLKKFGIPNKQSTLDLYSDSHFGRNLDIRWYRTHGEQFHAKLAAFKRSDSFAIIGGSANFTSKNLDNYNLELNLRVDTCRESRLCREVCSYFHRLWSNEDGLYTLDYEELMDKSRLKYILYRVQEGTGMCTY